MKKGQRPSKHLRVVKTKRGRKQVRVNPMISKKTTNKQYKKALKKLAPFADADKDGVPNILDSKPFDKKKSRKNQGMNIPRINEMTNKEFKEWSKGKRIVRYTPEEVEEMINE